MNRYKTAPGLGPSKASGTTICQKCLQKGHYSYECKSALQSRPYVSRASRTQQLRNPKLKPALSEVKLEEDSKKPELPKADPGEHDEGENLGNAKIDSLGQDRPTKRQRRSDSVSSADSVSTISTNASDTKPIVEDEPQSRNVDAPEPTSPGRSFRSPVTRRRNRVDSRSRSPPRVQKPFRKRTAEHKHSQPDRSPRRDKQNVASLDTKQGSSSASRSNNNSRRERSLSPYSRRLALTQAMNMH